LVGWATNVLAIKMTFYPVEFFGIRPIGWQGIIPSKAKLMAEKAVDLWTSKLIDLEFEFDKIEPVRIAEEMGPAIENLSRQIIDEVMMAKMPKIWAATPETARKKVYERISEDLPLIVERMMVEIKKNFNQMLDLKYLAVTALTQNKRLLNQVFQNCGHVEFKFIKRSGLYFGFLFGLIQMTVWYFFPHWWILPLFGIMVGYVTNYLALQLIFRPLKPIHFFGLHIQGMFIKRQTEVSVEYSRIVASKIITIESIFEYIIRGPGKEQLTDIVREQIGNTIDNSAGIIKPFVEIATGSKTFLYIRNIASFRFMQELPMNIRHVFGYAENALALESVLRTKMTSLSSVEFEAFLRPVFKEDEFTLILVGAALGGIAGLLQYFVFF
jgi:uncharacterized membrane protein YheB (UPF0754 family)